MARKKQGLPVLSAMELERLTALQEFIGIDRLQQVLHDTATVIAAPVACPSR